MDARNVLFPMTAGDLVLSAKVAMWRPAGTKTELILLEVGAVARQGDELMVTFLPTLPLTEYTSILFKPDTPLLVTNISRS